MKSSQVKDSAIGGYALKLAQKAPESAMNWASQIDNSKNRLKALIRTSRYAYQKDNTVLQSWLKNSTLTEKEKSIIIKANRKRKKR